MGKWTSVSITQSFREKSTELLYILHLHTIPNTHKHTHMFLCGLLSALLIYHPSLSRYKENGWHVSWHRALRGWWYVLFSSFFQMNSVFMFFLFIFYPVVVNARENNLDDIYTMLHHFQDDFIRSSSLFALHFMVVLDDFLDISVSVMKWPYYQPLLL